jgi:hypothetical protein
VVGADGGGGLRWSEPMMERVHGCVGPMSNSHAGYGAPLSDPMRWGEVRYNYISLFKENLL